MTMKPSFDAGREVLAALVDVKAAPAHHLNRAARHMRADAANEISLRQKEMDDRWSVPKHDVQQLRCRQKG